MLEASAAGTLAVCHVADGHVTFCTVNRKVQYSLIEFTSNALKHVRDNVQSWHFILPDSHYW